MGVKNVLVSCLSSGGNTGVGQCFTDIGFIKGIIFGPANVTYSTVTVAALKTALEAAILNDNPLLRLYPVGDLRVPTDNSEGVVTQTFADGSLAVVRNGNYDWDFQFVRGGLCLSIALQKANGQNRPFFLIDGNGKLFGVDAGVDLIKMIVPNLVYATPFKLNTGAATTIYSIRMNFSPEQLNVNAAFVDFTDDGGLPYLQSLEGLQNVTISQGAARAAGVFKVKLKTSCGTVDLHDQYAAELAVVSAFRVRNKATKSPLTVTAVADDTTNLGWTVTVSASDPNYTATALGLEVAMAGPTAIDGLVNAGFESNWLAQ